MSRLYAFKSWYDNRLGMITLEDDVLSIVSQVRELYGDKVTIELDPDSGHYHFVGHDNSTDYLIFTTPELDGRAVERLIKADQQVRGHESPLDAAEREQDELDAQKEAAQLERVHESAERLAWAMGDGRYGPGYKQSISISKDLDA